MALSSRLVKLLSPFAPHRAEELWQIRPCQTVAYETVAGLGCVAGERKRSRWCKSTARCAFAIMFPTGANYADLEAAAPAMKRSPSSSRSRSVEDDRRSRQDGEFRGEVTTAVVLLPPPPRGFRGASARNRRQCCSAVRRWPISSRCGRDDNGRRHSRGDSEAHLEGGRRQVPLAQLGQHTAQVGPGLDIVFVQFDRHVVALAGRPDRLGDRAARPIGSSLRDRDRRRPSPRDAYPPPPTGGPASSSSVGQAPHLLRRNRHIFHDRSTPASAWSTAFRRSLPRFRLKPVLPTRPRNQNATARPPRPARRPDAPAGSTLHDDRWIQDRPLDARQQPRRSATFFSILAERRPRGTTWPARWATATS